MAYLDLRSGNAGSAMIKRYIEYREMQQLRKDHLRKQSMRYLLVFFAIMGTILLVTYAVDAFKPAEMAKSTSVESVSTVSAAEQQKTQEIEEFAYIVTKPLGDLTDEDFDFIDTKAKDPCYEKYAMLSSEQMIKKITACTARR